MFGKTKFRVYQENGYRFIKKEGEGTPVVFIHGMFGGLSNFDGLLKRMDGFTVYIPEIPLYDFPVSRLTVPGLTEWMQGFIDSQQLDRVILLGNSMGGHIALDYALRIPEQVQALVLTGSSGLFEEDFGSSRPRRFDREYIRERAALTFYEDLVDDVIMDEIMDVLQSRIKLVRLLRVARATHDYNLESRLAEIKQPTLLVWGRNDQITPPEVAETFNKKLPAARLEWIDKCGHAPMMEHPEAFAKYLHDFLTQLEPKPTKNGKNYEENYSYS